MGNWNSKNFIKEFIINLKFFYCNNCSVRTSLTSGVDYYYFGNGINRREYDYNPKDLSIEGLKNIKFYNLSLHNYETEIVSFNDYFANDYIVWKCERCYSINLSLALTPEPQSIIPTSDFFINTEEEEKIVDSVLKKLLREFYQVKTLRLNSSATMLARKILMHIAVEQNLAKTGEKFITYVDALKNSDLVSRNWKPKVDLIRKLGNDENHKIKIATDEELENISDVLKNLLQSIYVD